MVYVVEIEFSDGEKLCKTMPEGFELKDVQNTIGIISIGAILGNLMVIDEMKVKNIVVRDKTDGKVVFDLNEQLSKLTELWEKLNSSIESGTEDKEHGTKDGDENDNEQKSGGCLEYADRR